MSSCDSRPSWDEYFMNFAELASSRSTCLRRKVGAIIVRDNIIVSVGYNGAPCGVAHCVETGCLRKNLKIESGCNAELCRGLHAEQNAIIHALNFGGSLNTAVMYSSVKPCCICTKMIINAGIRRVIYKEDYSDKLGEELARESGLMFEKFSIL